jgi:energy-coupling factor transporter ATP-binding protein EcfA2
MIELDTESISRTYAAALKIPILDDKNRVAYEQLSALAKTGPSGGNGIIYLRAFLFHRSAEVSQVLDKDDFRMRAAESFHGVLEAGREYGAKRGQWNLVVGRSGSGKTSYLRAMEGELTEVVGGAAAPLSDVPYFFLSQRIEIFENLSPIENVTAFGAGRQEAIGILRQLGMSDRLLRRRDSRGLSGGERQRVAIAQCLAARAAAIVMDEPLKDLDKARRATLFELLDSSFRIAPSGGGITLICVDHDFESIYRRFDIVFEMLYGWQVPIWLKT